MTDRLRTQNKRVLDRAHDDAVRLAKLGDGLVSGGAQSLSTVTESESIADENGNTLEGAMLWGDNWGSNWSQ